LLPFWPKISATLIETNKEVRRIEIQSVASTTFMRNDLQKHLRSMSRTVIAHAVPICKRRRETVALGGRWRAVKLCSARMFRCWLRNRLEGRHHGGFPGEQSGGDKWRGCSPTSKSWWKYAVAFWRASWANERLVVNMKSTSKRLKNPQSFRAAGVSENETTIIDHGCVWADHWGDSVSAGILGENQQLQPLADASGYNV